MKPVSESKRMLARMCVALESYGADIQGYIRDNMPSITPRAAWYNLQREYLQRKPANLSEGKADEKKMAKSRQSQEKTVMMLIEAARNDQDAYAVLKACGFTNPFCALRNAKAWCKANRPELLPGLSGLSVPKNDDQETLEMADSAACESLPKDDSPKAAETPETAKERQTDGIPQERPVCTCCVHGRDSGVTVPDEIPKIKMKVIEVETDLGSFRKEEGKIAFRRVDDGTDYKNQLKMTPVQWRQLMAELDDVLEMLEAIE